jgi:hypothetical protein
MFLLKRRLIAALLGLILALNLLTACGGEARVDDGTAPGLVEPGEGGDGEQEDGGEEGED